MTDISEIRALVVELHGLTKADAAYTLYYDETNNARRLHVMPDGFNVKEPACFVTVVRPPPSASLTDRRV